MVRARVYKYIYAIGKEYMYLILSGMYSTSMEYVYQVPTNTFAHSELHTIKVYVHISNEITSSGMAVHAILVNH